MLIAGLSTRLDAFAFREAGRLFICQIGELRRKSISSKAACAVNGTRGLERERCLAKRRRRRGAARTTYLLNVPLGKSLRLPVSSFQDHQTLTLWPIMDPKEDVRNGECLLQKSPV